MKRPVVFLDFDGVLNTCRTWGLRPLLTKAIEDEKVARLEAFCQEHNAMIVLSTTWRRLMPLNEIYDMLQRKGLSRERIVGITPTLVGPYTRGDEITAWLAKYPGCSNYVIFDDMDPGQFLGHRDRLIQTSVEDGLTAERCDAARAILTGVGTTSA